MRQPTWTSVAVAALLALLPGMAAQADVFNMGGTRNPDGSWNGLANLEFVPVRNPNENDPETGYGRVADPYWIGKFEVTNAQWREFLTAKARLGDPYGLYNTEMAGYYGSIARSGSGTQQDPYVYTAKGGDANRDNRPVNFVSFWDAARFCNWLHNGHDEDADTESGAYRYIGDQANFARELGAKYFIPTENEWYKAAYFDPNKGEVGVPGYWDYPMMSDSPTVPSNDRTDPDGGNNANFYQNGYTIGALYYATVVGDFENSPSAYGTFDQGGNHWEWNETPIGVLRGLRGGAWDGHSGYLHASYRRNDCSLTNEFSDIGFRVASIPEPGSITLLLCGAIAGLLWWRRRR